MYALFEETEMGDLDRTREVWKACLEILPHKKVGFSYFLDLPLNFLVKEMLNLQVLIRFRD